MANSVMTITETITASGTVKKLKAVWLSDDSNGIVNASTTNTYDGYVLAAVTVPGAGTPTNSYNVAVYDSDGVDVCLGALANRSNASTQFANSVVLGAVASSKLAINVSGAGNAKNGVLYMYFR
jgi:hypothetical protein